MTLDGMTPEIMEGLFRDLQADSLATVQTAAESLALTGDRSIIPRLIQVRQTVTDELEQGANLHRWDAAEERRIVALTMAIISLLTPAECETLLETGSELEKGLIRVKQNRGSVEKFWSR